MVTETSVPSATLTLLMTTSLFGSGSLVEVETVAVVAKFPV